MLTTSLISFVALATSISLTSASPIKRCATTCTPSVPAPNVKFLYSANTSLELGFSDCEACTNLGLYPTNHGVDYFKIQDTGSPSLKRILSPNYSSQTLTVNLDSGATNPITRAPESPRSVSAQDIFELECDSCNNDGSAAGCAIKILTDYPNHVDGTYSCLNTNGSINVGGITLETCSGSAAQKFDITIETS